MDRIGRYRDRGYRRLFAAARKSLERTGGDLSRSVTVRDPDETERKALIGIIGYRAPGVRSIRVRLAELDEVVRNGTDLSLAELLGTIGPAVRDRPAEASARDRARTDLLRVATASPLYASAGWYHAWVDAPRGRLTRVLNAGDARVLTQAVAVLEHLDGRPAGAAPLSLPKLAVTTTGDTKALGHGTTLAGLVLDALAARAGVDRGRDAESSRALWETVDVLPDEFASRVLVLNLPAEGRGLGEWLSGAARLGTPFQVTLHQLRTLPVTTRCPVVFVCENPAILGEAAERLGPASPPLLCTEGLPSIAFHRLAEAVTAGGGTLRYHGDFDWPGVAIADAVIRRHGAVPWRMSAADYRAGLAGHTRPLGGGPRDTPWAADLAPAMAEAGAVVYEEAVADRLIADLRDAG